MPTEAKVETAKQPLVHPAMRPKKPIRQLDRKQRRTTVRTIKLVNPLNDTPVLIQVPIEPGHNNHGRPGDPRMAINHYLDKGFVEPQYYEGVRIVIEGKEIPLGVIFCAVKDCWDAATATTDAEGTERCVDLEDMYRRGIIRYAERGESTVATEPKIDNELASAAKREKRSILVFRLHDHTIAFERAGSPL